MSAHLFYLISDECCPSYWHSSYCHNVILPSIILQSFIILTVILEDVVLHNVILKIAFLLNVNQKSLVNFRTAECCFFKSFCRVSFFEVKYTNCHAVLHSVILKNVILLTVIQEGFLNFITKQSDSFKVVILQIEFIQPGFTPFKDSTIWAPKLADPPFWWKSNSNCSYFVLFKDVS